MTDLLAQLKDVCRSGDGWTARCPAHADRHNSLSIHHRNGRWLLKCHAGCGWREIINALGIDASALFDKNGGRGEPIPAGNRATVQPRRKSSETASAGGSSQTSVPPDPNPLGLTLEQYAAAKALPIKFLKTCGLLEFTYDHKPAIRIPYFGVAGEELAVRFRIGLDGDRFRWKSGTKSCLYGLHRLHDAQKEGVVVLVEGESDCHTLCISGFLPAVGDPFLRR